MEDDGHASGGAAGYVQMGDQKRVTGVPNLMIAAEALGLNTCPMEGLDGRRLGKLLGLSGKYHEIVMVIAIGKKSARHVDQPQWRRPLEATVRIV